jgi:anhydro-N-acetylmuramic acid kinase
MSGTSLDGADCVICEIENPSITDSTVSTSSPPHFKVVANTSLPYSAQLKQRVLALQDVGRDELHRANVLGSELALLYVDVIQAALYQGKLSPDQISAVGVHGQTIRHAPNLQASSYSIQLNNGALIAERIGIDVVTDFRSRDLAAGGQGAPLVPAFHRAVFGHPTIHRTIVNIGGIANLTELAPGGALRSGFDTGPGNMLMDAWCTQHLGKAYDENGAWAASGQIHFELLNRMLKDAYFPRAAPKSTGRDLFNMNWLNQRLEGFAISPVDVQASLLALTTQSIAQAIAPSDTQEVVLCGGGALNGALTEALGLALKNRAGNPIRLTRSDAVSEGVSLGVMDVEAAAFAWLAQRFVNRLTGNLPAATGANGPRVLGALYPK